MVDLSHQSVSLLPGVGPKRCAHLATLGIHTIRDALYYFPVRYENLVDESSSEPAHQEIISAQVTVSGAPAVRHGGARSSLSVSVTLGTSTIKAIFYNQPYLRHQLKPGVILRIRGKYDAKFRSISVSSHEVMRSNYSNPAFAIVPIYRSAQNIPQSMLRRLIEDALRLYALELDDLLPVSLRERFRLLSIHEAIVRIHQPKVQGDIFQARRRLIFEEFLYFQIKLQGIRHTRRLVEQEPIDQDVLNRSFDQFERALPFSLTQDQKACLREIADDIARPVPMHRILQGDVGSGKTAVVFALCTGLAKLGYQTALMVPTTILAAQHFEDALRLLSPHGVRIGFLAGNMPAKDRSQLLSRVAMGEVDLLIGTHVLASDNVYYARLRLAVIDEQHRFGVETRRFLREKGKDVDLLQLTATPIPRSFALMLYQDVGVSSIRELPPGRKPIMTKFLKAEQESTAIKLLRQELGKGRQAFLIAPRISAPNADPEDTQTAESGSWLCDISATALHERMSEELAPWNIGLVHGLMSEALRDENMTKFVSGEIQALVATTIVEVGVSVPNASLMVVYGADRFGLATLHQLRGRVGRGEHASMCVLIGTPKTEQGKERIRAMLRTQDGFLLSEQDLQLRGPGEVFGGRQSGMPVFKLGDVTRDLKIMQVARDVVGQWLRSEDFWLLPSYQRLRDMISLSDNLSDS